MVAKARRVMQKIDHARSAAAQALSKMKSFDEWIATASADQLSAAESVFGSARRCYDEIEGEFRRWARPH
jgi:hypothetical protein